MSKIKEPAMRCQAMVNGGGRSFYYTRCSHPAKRINAMIAMSGEPVEVHLCGIHVRQAEMGRTFGVAVGEIENPGFQNGRWDYRRMRGTQTDTIKRQAIIARHDLELNDKRLMIWCARQAVGGLVKDRVELLRSVLEQANPDVFEPAFANIDKAVAEYDQLMAMDPLAGTPYEGTTDGN